MITLFTGNGLDVLRLWKDAPQTHAVRVKALGGPADGVAEIWQGPQWTQRGSDYDLIAPEPIYPGETIGVSEGRISHQPSDWPCLDGVP